jgi:hypothetical protein
MNKALFEHWSRCSPRVKIGHRVRSHDPLIYTYPPDFHFEEFWDLLRVKNTACGVSNFPTIIYFRNYCPYIVESHLINLYFGGASRELELVRWVYEGERVKGNRGLRVKSWMIENTFVCCLLLYGLSFCNESGAYTSGLCRVIRLPSLFRDHLRRISSTNR